MAVQLVLAQLRAQMALPEYAQSPALGLVYITLPYASHAARILECLATELPGVSDWAGAAGAGVCAAGVEYLDEPALSVMLCDLPRDQYRVWSGLTPLPPAMRFRPHMALVHADGNTPDLPDLIDELAARTASGYLFGGLTASRAAAAPQFAWSGPAQGLPPGSAADGVFAGGLSGVAFGRGVLMASRVTQSCQPIASEHRVTSAEDNILLALDHQPALDVLIDDLGLDTSRPHRALAALRQTLAGLAEADEDGVRRTGDFGPGVRVRHLIGIDPGRRAVVIADEPQPGQRLAFCQRNARAARADLVRICAEIREVLEPRQIIASDDDADANETAPASGARICGAHYVSCASRGGAYFGASAAQLHAIRQTLGDVPLVGFFADGEIAYRYLYGYTGVLTVFAERAPG
jgi:small ligand-binding sensory domain FIST